MIGHKCTSKSILSAIKTLDNEFGFSKGENKNNALVEVKLHQLVN